MATEEKLNVLLIEDYIPLSREISRLLNDRGFNVKAVSHPSEAEAILKAQEVDVIVSEVVFDARPGLIFEDFLKSSIARRIGIVIFTGAVWDGAIPDLREITIVRKTEEKCFDKLLSAIETAHREASRLTVLYLEYDTSLIEQIWGALERKGFNVIPVTNPRDALEKLDSERVDVVLSDVVFTGSSASTFEVFLRRCVELKIGLVFLTGARYGTLIDGLDDFHILDKLCTNEEIAVALRECFGKNKGRMSAVTVDEATLHTIANPQSHVETPIGKWMAGALAGKDEREMLSVYREYVRRGIRAGVWSKRQLIAHVDRYNRLTARLK